MIHIMILHVCRMYLPYVLVRVLVPRDLPRCRDTSYVGTYYQELLPYVYPTYTG